MGDENYYGTFCIKRDECFTSLRKEYDLRIERARDGYKLNAHYLFEQDILRSEQGRLNQSLGRHARFYMDVRDYVNLDNRLDLLNEFNIRYDGLNDKSEALLIAIGEIEGLSLMYDYWHKQRARLNTSSYEEIVSNNEISKPYESSIVWTGESETQFVQLVYSLCEAGLIKHSSNEKTKLVKDFAEMLNFHLGKNWQSNLSKSINNTNSDYTPSIFKDLENGFSRYRTELINKKKKN